DGIKLYIKDTKETIEQFICLEESGDEGDNYDYSYPSEDMKNKYIFKNANYSFVESNETSTLNIEGDISCPKNLESRKYQQLDKIDQYKIQITLRKKSNVIDVKGSYENHCENHRVRLIVKSPFTTKYSLAGTQFGYIKRENEPVILKEWKQKGWLEEPSPIYPLLNYVILEDKTKKISVFTKSSKEYEIIGNNYSDIAITLFRSVGHLGLPDLNRRPGRASGIAEKIIPSPLSQMIKNNTFEVGIVCVDNRNINSIVQMYNEFAVEDCYYQNQKFNKVVYPISYFQTNPLKTEISDSYVMSTCEDINCVFSTLEIINGKKIMRVFNVEDEKKVKSLIHKYDMFANEIEVSDTVRRGEIINLVLKNEK
ncbi:MAG: glycoside hydrolase family 38 C-terminal domain-containing protein, partial [Longicatena sp.]